ncbi:MAG: phosphate ABC transporter ATP-binding protein, partial [Beijerinckiaceae bacterium]
MDVAAPGKAQSDLIRLDVKNLNFYYGDHRALKDNNLSFYDRQVTAL